MQEFKFAADSALEGGVSCRNRSLKVAQIPC